MCRGLQMLLPVTTGWCSRCAPVLRVRLHSCIGMKKRCSHDSRDPERYNRESIVSDMLTVATKEWRD